MILAVALLCSGIIGCVYIVYWAIEFPNQLKDVLVFKDREYWYLSIIIICYIIGTISSLIYGIGGLL